MVKVGSPLRRGRDTRLPKTPVGWLATGLLGLAVAVLLIGAVTALANGAPYLWYLAAEATVFDTWSVLTLASILLSLIAIVGAGFAVSRVRMVPALLFAALSLPATFVIEGSRCDTPASCRAWRWAALPPGAFDWQVRLRPVDSPNEAEAIASDALQRADSEDRPFQAKRLGDHWIVSAIDADGWPGARAVRIDTRTGGTTLVPCPQDRIRCGMERPTVSDGRRVYRDTRLGLSAVFPASRPVCTARGDDGEPRGFYAMVRAPDVPCESLDQSRQIGIEVAQSRLEGCSVVEARSVPWRPLSPETAKLFRDQRPTLSGFPSLACELRNGDQIQISVYASTGSGADPRRRYEGYIVTTPSYLAEDIRTFELFLASVGIGTF